MTEKVREARRTLKGIETLLVMSNHFCAKRPTQLWKKLVMALPRFLRVVCPSNQPDISSHCSVCNCAL